MLAVNGNRDTLYTGSHDGFVTCWDVATGDNDRINGTGHGNQMNGMVTIGESVFTCGIDDSIKEINTLTKSFTSTNIKLPSQPRGLAGQGLTLVVPCEKEVSCFLCFSLSFFHSCRTDLRNVCNSVELCTSKSGMQYQFILLLLIHDIY